MQKEHVENEEIEKVVEAMNPLDENEENELHIEIDTDINICTNANTNTENESTVPTTTLDPEKTNPHELLEKLLTFLDT